MVIAILKKKCRGLIAIVSFKKKGKTTRKTYVPCTYSCLLGKQNGPIVSVERRSRVVGVRGTSIDDPAEGLPPDSFIREDKSCQAEKEAC